MTCLPNGLRYLEKCKSVTATGDAQHLKSLIAPVNDNCLMAVGNINKGGILLPVGHAHAV